MDGRVEIGLGVSRLATFQLGVAMPQTTTRIYRMPEQLGPYESLQKLGRGAMNYVLRGVHRQTGQSVALKVLAPHQSQRPENMQRWRAESQAGLAIRHASVVACHDVGQQGDWAYLVQELVEGGDLAELRERSGGRLVPALVVRLGIALARGLTAVHRAGWIHRDVKPSNVLLCRNSRPKLADFGVATPLAEGQPGILVGSPAFMAPEQIRGEPATAGVDCYGLAVTLFQLLTGELPFERTPEAIMSGSCPLVAPPSVQDIVPSLPHQFDAFFQRALAVDPGKRYVNAGALAGALLDILPMLRPVLPTSSAMAPPQADMAFRPASWVEAL